MENVPAFAHDASPTSAPANNEASRTTKRRMNPFGIRMAILDDFLSDFCDRFLKLDKNTDKFNAEPYQLAYSLTDLKYRSGFKLAFEY